MKGACGRPRCVEIIQAARYVVCWLRRRRTTTERPRARRHCRLGTDDQSRTPPSTTARRPTTPHPRAGSSRRRLPPTDGDRTPPARGRTPATRRSRRSSTIRRPTSSRRRLAAVRAAEKPPVLDYRSCRPKIDYRSKTDLSSSSPWLSFRLPVEVLRRSVSGTRPPPPPWSRAVTGQPATRRRTMKGACG